MSDSNKTSELNKALAKAQSEMASVGKNKTNPHFKSNYADLSAVIEACMPALNSNGIAVVQTTEMREGGQMVMVTTLMHSSGESVASEMPLLIGKQDMQGLGSAITYARRYSLMGVAALAPDDDDGPARVESSLVLCAGPSSEIDSSFVSQVHMRLEEEDVIGLIAI